MAYRKRHRGTTTQRGVGHAHVKDKRAKMAALRDGIDRCPYCGWPMWRTQELELDHHPGRVFGGPQVTRLAHARCNRSAGAAMGNRLRGQRRDGRRRRWVAVQPLRTSRDW